VAFILSVPSHSKSMMTDIYNIFYIFMFGDIEKKELFN